MRALTVLLTALLAASTAAEERSSATFEIRFVGDGALTAISRLALTNMSDRSVVREVALHDGRGSATEAAGTEWQIAIPQPDFWTPATTVVFPAAGGVTQSIDVWRTGVLTGSVSSPHPGQLSLHADAPVEGIAPAIARGTSFPCTVTENGTFACTLPATKLNLVLRAPGMTPHYLWDVAVIAGETRNLGRFVLKPGGSFTARLDKTIAAQLERPARARLLRPVADLQTESTARLSVPAAEADFDKRGFVQLAPLGAGRYVLEVRAEGFAKATIGPVDIYDGKETAYRKLIELFPPVKATIAIDPPSDTDGRPWRVEWQPVGHAEPAMVAHANDAGIAVIDDQSPGLFFVSVSDAEGNRLWDGQVQLHEQDVHVPIDLDLHVVNGTVSLGDTALSGAQIWFGTADGATRVRTDAGEEGRFRVRLPRLGTWTVEVRSDAPPAKAIVTVAIEEDEEVSIVLPNTAVSGWVVDEAGERVRRGELIVIAAGQGFTSRLSSTGEFQLRGIPEGRLELRARDLMTGGSTTNVPLHVVRDRPLRDVELRIQKRRKLAGRVVSGGRAIPGAGVSVTPRLPSGANVMRAATDVEGKFELNVPAQATQAHVVVSVPARTMEAFEIVLNDQVHVFDVAPAGGTVEIRTRMLGNPPFLLTQNGVLLPLHALIDWILAHGQPVDDPSRLRVPDLAPGQYRLCVQSGKCAEGVLAPGAMLTLAAAE